MVMVTMPPMIVLADLETFITDHRSHGELSAMVGDRAVGRRRLEQFHLGAAEGQGHDGGTVGGVGRVRLDAEDVTIECQRLRDVRHGDADMSDAGLIGQSVLREDDATGDVPAAGNLKGER